MFFLLLLFFIHIISLYFPLVYHPVILPVLYIQAYADLVWFGGWTSRHSQGIESALATFIQTEVDWIVFVCLCTE